MSHISENNAIKRLLANAQKVDYSVLLGSVVAENSVKLCDILREQLRMGEGGNGDIEPKYQAGYLNYKKSLPTYYAGSKVDLYLTGDFQKAIILNINGNQYEFDSRDWKRTELLEKYGEQIFELNQLSKELAQELITPLFMANYLKAIHT